jgi:hypothetical protein
VRAVADEHKSPPITLEDVPFQIITDICLDVTNTYLLALFKGAFPTVCCCPIHDGEAGIDVDDFRLCSSPLWPGEWTLKGIQPTALAAYDHDGQQLLYIGASDGSVWVDVFQPR